MMYFIGFLKDLRPKDTSEWPIVNERI